MLVAARKATTGFALIPGAEQAWTVKSEQPWSFLGVMQALYNSLYGAAYVPIAGRHQLCAKRFGILLNEPTDCFPDLCRVAGPSGTN